MRITGESIKRWLFWNDGRNRNSGGEVMAVLVRMVCTVILFGEKRRMRNNGMMCFDEDR